MHGKNWVQDVPLSPLKYPQLCAVWFGPKSTAISESSYIVIKYVCTCVLSSYFYIPFLFDAWRSHFLNPQWAHSARVYLKVSYETNLRHSLEIPPIYFCNFSRRRCVFFHLPQSFFLGLILLVNISVRIEFAMNHQERSYKMTFLSSLSSLSLNRPLLLSLSQWNYKWKSIITHIHSRCAQKRHACYFTLSCSAIVQIWFIFFSLYAHSSARLTVHFFINCIVFKCLPCEEEWREKNESECILNIIPLD